MSASKDIVATRRPASIRDVAPGGLFPPSKFHMPDHGNYGPFMAERAVPRPKRGAGVDRHAHKGAAAGESLDERSRGGHTARAGQHQIGAGVYRRTARLVGRHQPEIRADDQDAMAH